MQKCIEYSIDIDDFSLTTLSTQAIYARHRNIMTSPVRVDTSEVIQFSTRVRVTFLNIEAIWY